MNIILLFAALLGLSSMMMGAYVDHALASSFNAETLNVIWKAVRYHQLYAVVIAALGLALPLQTNTRIKKWLTRTAYIFIIGILFFSGGIYLSMILNYTHVIYLTPIGGMTLMLGWFFLCFVAMIKR